MDWNKPFLVTNISKGRLVTGAISIPSGGSIEVDPLKFSNKAVDSLQVFYQRKHIDVKNIVVETVEKKNDIENIEKVETEGNEHVVYNPNKKEKAITVDGLSGNEKAVKVDSNIIGNEPAVSVAYSEIDEIEAVEFLNQHWKRVQADIKEAKSKKKLELYLEVAERLGVADKKIEIIKERLSELA